MCRIRTRWLCLLVSLAWCPACDQPAIENLSQHGENNQKTAQGRDNREEGDDPDEEAAFIRKGQEEYYAEQWESSLASFDKALEVNRASKQAHLWRARVLLELKRLEEATASLTRCLEIDPTFQEARFERARVHLISRDYANADKELATLAEQGASGVSLRMARAIIDLNLNRPRQAIAELEMAGRVDGSPDTAAAAHLLLARIFAACQDDELRNGELAVAHAKIANDIIRDKHVHVLTALAMANAESGNYQHAVKWQKEANEIASPADREDFQMRLTLYESERPYRASGEKLAHGFKF